MWAIVRKDLMVLFKDSGAVSTLFLMPLLFILLMSFALGGQMGGGEAETKIELPVVYAKGDKLAKEVVGELKKINGLEVEESIDGDRLDLPGAEALIKEGDRRWALVFPDDFTERLEAEERAEVKFIADPAADAASVAPLQGTINGLLAQVSGRILIESQIEELLKESAQQTGAAGSEGPEEPDAAVIVKQISAAGAKPLAELRRRDPAGMRPAKEPNAVQHNVPSFTTMFVFFIVIVLAESVMMEKTNGTFRRLLAAPIGKATLLVGKTIPYYLINVMQVAIMFGVGRLVFGMSLGRSPLALVVMTLSLAAAATGLGVLVAALAKTNAQVNGIGVLLVLSLAAIGGVMVPLSLMPEAMQSFARLSPHSWALTGFQDIIVRGYGFSEILPEAGALLAFAAVFFIAGVARFKFE